jgi:hypothetical protein
VISLLFQIGMQPYVLFLQLMIEGDVAEDFLVGSESRGGAEAFAKHSTEPVSALGWPVDQVEGVLLVLSKGAAIDAGSAGSLDVKLCFTRWGEGPRK